jgi:hypothetical protein
VAVLRDFRITHKILSVTCDNASNNNKMVTEMEKLLTAFSSMNHTQCFAHIINLIAKSLLKQFDIRDDNERDKDLDDDERSLLALAEDIEHEELTTAQEKDDDDGEIEEEDGLEGWVDEVEALSPTEQANLEESVRPVKRALVKVTRM